MKNNHVVGVVDNANSGGSELSDQMDVRAFCARSVKPRLSEVYDMFLISPLVLN